MTLPASYLTDALGQLLLALAELIEGSAFATASWDEEPGEYRWLFSRDGRRVSLQVLAFPDGWPRLPAADGTLVFASEGELDEMARAFTKGMRAVLEEWGEDGYKEKWHADPFPTEFLELVESAVDHA